MDLTKYETEHSKRISSYQKKITKLVKEVIDTICSLYAGKELTEGKPFKFSDYPAIKNKVDAILNEYANNSYTAIVDGVRSEWTFSENKNNEIFNHLFAYIIKDVPNFNYKKNIGATKKAVDAFIQRKTNGLNLSDRVWNIKEQLKEELEMSLSVGLEKGKSAQKLSRDVRSYLNEPNKLFRRVRNKYGQLELSKNAKAYHPGQGVYRSSYKNAIRLTGTETNIAYRTADYLRWQQEDFVLGIKIELSNNHTLNGKPFTDICDELQGKYPKDFKFTGWHPFCRCHAITILPTTKEIIDHRKNGTPYNYVKDTPKQFKQWIDDNTDRLQRSKSLPYFVRDNEKYFPEMRITNQAMKGVKEAQNFNDEMQDLTRKPTALEIAQTRHANR